MPRLLLAFLLVVAVFSQKLTFKEEKMLAGKQMGRKEYDPRLFNRIVSFINDKMYHDLHYAPVGSVECTGTCEIVNTTFCGSRVDYKSCIDRNGESVNEEIARSGFAAGISIMGPDASPVCLEGMRNLACWATFRPCSEGKALDTVCKQACDYMLEACDFSDHDETIHDECDALPSKNCLTGPNFDFGPFDHERTVFIPRAWRKTVYITLATLMLCVFIFFCRGTETVESLRGQDQRNKDANV